MGVGPNERSDESKRMSRKRKDGRTSGKRGLWKLVGHYLEYRETCCDISSVPRREDGRGATVRAAKEFHITNREEERSR